MLNIDNRVPHIRIVCCGLGFLFALIPLRGLLSALARHSVIVRSALAYSQPCSHLLKIHFLKFLVMSVRGDFLVRLVFPSLKVQFMRLGIGAKFPHLKQLFCLDFLYKQLGQRNKHNLI